MRTPDKTRWTVPLAVALAIFGFLAAVLATGDLIDGAIGALTNGLIGLAVGIGIDQLRSSKSRRTATAEQPCEGELT